MICKFIPWLHKWDYLTPFVTVKAKWNKQKKQYEKHITRNIDTADARRCTGCDLLQLLTNNS